MRVRRATEGDAAAIVGLDMSLYDPAETPGETALFLAREV